MKQTQQLFFIECFNEHVPKDAETEIHPTCFKKEQRQPSCKFARIQKSAHSLKETKMDV